MSESTPAITAFLVWVDLDGNIHAEIGPEMPALDTKRLASLNDIANFSELMAHEARMEIYRRFTTGEQPSTASIVSKALKKRRG